MRLSLPNIGISRTSTANDSITAEIGLDTRIERLPSGHHQRLAQRPVPCRRRGAKPQDQRRSRIVELPHKDTPAARNTRSSSRSNRLPDTLYTPTIDTPRMRRIRARMPAFLSTCANSGYKGQVEDKQHDVADVHARTTRPQKERRMPRG